jgi:hypothetical protein
MKLTTILIGGAVLVGLGFYLSKKFSAKNEDEDDVVIVAGEKETYGEKIHKASLFAVGAIKTSADKIAEGFNDIRSQDMVEKGEKCIGDAKKTAGSFVGELKEKVKGRDKGVIADEDDAEDGDDDYFMAEAEADGEL